MSDSSTDAPNRVPLDQSRRETALQFVTLFCAGDIDGLRPLLCDDLHFRGPLHQFDSRDSYLKVLIEDPPQRCEVEMLSVTQADDSVALFYEYQKAGGSLTIAQLFRFRGIQIRTITLVFDGRSFD